MSSAASASIDGAASDGRSSSTAAEQGEGARSWWCCRPSLASVLLLTMAMLLLSAGWVHQRKAQSRSRVPAFEQLHAWQVVSTRMRDQYQPCSPRPEPKQAACKLQGNVVATRRQLRDCGFQAVVVVPLAQVQSPQNVPGTTRQTDYSALPFPVVTCTVKPGLPDIPGSFQDSSSLDSPPCIRPSVGRDDVAYTSFILQNWDHLPPHLFFVHGHETSWHQDSDSTQIIREFCDRNLSQSMFVSLTNNVGRDWRRIFCVAGQCGSARKQRELEKAWHKYLGYYLGPLPPDFTHFCCSQFAVSRSRVLLRARQLYLNILTFSLMEYPGIYEAMPCYGKCELPGAVMEVLWPYVFGAGVPLGYDERLEMEWPTDEYLPRQLMRAYRYAWSTDDWLREPLASG